MLKNRPSDLGALEPRVLLAATWPNAPLPGATPVYLSPTGYAEINAGLSAAGEIDAYNLGWDRGGSYSVYTDGPTNVETAAYESTGQPAATSSYSGAWGRSTASAPLGRTSLWLSRAPRPARTGCESEGRRRTSTHWGCTRTAAGHWRCEYSSTVSTAYDADFYRLTTSDGGTWMLTITPQASLQPMLTLYDGYGIPTNTCSYTTGVAAAGAGTELTWQTTLAANSTYYIRIDGVGATTGNYALAFAGPPAVAGNTASTYPGIPDDVLTAYDYSIPDENGRRITTIDGLVRAYAPIMRLNGGGDEWTNEVEVYHPKDVGIVLAHFDLPPNNPTISDGDNDYVQTLTSLSQLGAYNSAAYQDYCIDYPGSFIQDLESLYNQVKDQYPDTVYAMVLKDDDSDMLIVQYNFFYYGNDFFNNHEGDWEKIEILFDKTGPYQARYSAHNGAADHFWQQIPKTNVTHPDVYVGEGGHASYWYAGVSGIAELSESVPVPEFPQGNGAVLYPQGLTANGYVVQVLPTDRAGDLTNIGGKDLSWVKYEGHWGEWNYMGLLTIGGDDGPAGPWVGSRWSQSRFDDRTHAPDSLRAGPGRRKA